MVARASPDRRAWSSVDTPVRSFAVASDANGIEWCTSTWNPVTGGPRSRRAAPIATPLSLRFKWSANRWLPKREAENVVLHPDRVDHPLRWRRPRIIFVNSMSDLFHERVLLSFVQRVVDAMLEAERHTFQILTKRAERLAALAPQLRWPANVRMGVSVENDRLVKRGDYLREVPAAVRLVSVEPLLGPLDGLDLTGIDWVVAGGESGARHRPMRPEWMRALRDRCAQTECRSSSNSGVVRDRSRVAGGSMARNTPRCRSA